MAKTGARALLPTLAITLGEPAGIGPEVVAAALRSPRLPKGFRYEVLGSAEGVAPGRPTARSAGIALKALEAAAAGWKAGRYAAVVTGPVQKETLIRASKGLSFPYPGQTEFFAARCGVPEDDVVMAMASPRLVVALLSTHLSLRRALGKITREKILRVVVETAAFLQAKGVRAPRIALAGVNPHAGENGLFGDEEGRILVPALAAAREAFPGLALTGPHSPDTVFWRARNGEFDAVVCAYHDQGLIPFKLLAFHDGVNVSLGLPLIRTSPDHGTALDLAGKGKADPRSMIAAIVLAARLVKSRQASNRR
ncbi:4-hydroxythreonine-4-phosphate dehydrogenase [Verrucomicrobium sp. GAS474]|uniref:4-hydroxythreonine-4-phosphate dehydrogenase PdxA n=1 Tax=Verrucomicrobium sp. GAS474 TaxID=1882831 RepID=UPI00087C52CA|nr:4-hydroxythreonine-4-phosphate dehydrogenase PdxA [Verrucomicrobium sp. GAS474]SDT99836.1 4-hydroxythreonine-4-phosphate dehydrogenase [Verrucomicrobium sp. GAS474]